MQQLIQNSKQNNETHPIIKKWTMELHKSLSQNSLITQNAEICRNNIYTPLNSRLTALSE